MDPHLVLDPITSIHERTRRVAALIPGDRLEWTPDHGVMSPGDLVRHIAITKRLMWAETIAGRPSRYVTHGRELADGKEAVLAFFDRCHAEAMAIFESLSAADLDERCTTPAGATMVRWKWLRSMTEHEIHHRGQLYLMLRLMDVPTPSIFGLTSEEVKAKGQG